MTATERAIAAMYYRLIYIQKLKKISDVPEQYRKALEQYRKEMDGK